MHCGIFFILKDFVLCAIIEENYYDKMLLLFMFYNKKIFVKY